MSYGEVPDSSASGDQAPSGVIELAPMGDDEMEIIGTSVFDPPPDIIPPGFPQGAEDEHASPNVSSSEPPPSAPAGDEYDEDMHFGKEKQRDPYLRQRDDLAGNEVTYKIITIAMTIVTFLTLNVIGTLRMGIGNPYDKLFFVRLLIFSMILSFTVYVCIQKELRNKEPLIKKIIIGLAIAGFIGSFMGSTGIGTSAESNFFTYTGTPYYRLVDKGRAYARKPVVAPNNKNVVITYAPDLAFRPAITLLEIDLKNEDEPAKMLKTSTECSGKPYWYSPTEVIYPGRKSNPFEPFRFNLFEVNSRSSTTLYSTVDYNFILDYHYNYKTRKIAASFSGIIWTLDPLSGEVLPVSGLDSLLRQYEARPDHSAFNADPRAFISSLAENAASITSPPFFDEMPRFNGTGKYVYYTRSTPGTQNSNDIFRVNLHKVIGSEKKQQVSSYEELHDYLYELSEIVTSDPYRYTCIAVSPNGRFVASWANATAGDGVRKTEKALVLFDIVEKTHIRIFPFYSTLANVQSLDWSPDGSFIVADMNSTLNSIIAYVGVPNLVQKLDKKYGETD